jgi:hypothetical protein
MLVLVPADAATLDALPSDVDASAALAASPAVAAARAGLDAARASHALGLVERPGWTATSALAGRSGGGSNRTRDVELLIERNLRLPGKRAAAERLGQAREQAALHTWQLVWREQARSLLDRQAAWLRDCQSAAVWADQQALLNQQARSVARRQTLGDAATVDARQAQAAATQAATQAQLGEARCNTSAAVLQAQFPGLHLGDGRAPLAAADLPGAAGAGAGSAAARSAPLDTDLTTSIAAWLAASPELAVARREALALDAMLAVDLADLRGDPIVGLRLGGNSNGERLLGLQIAVSFGGGEHQRATQHAYAARLVAAEADIDVLQRRLSAEAVQVAHEATATRVAWRGAQLAAAQLADSAAALARGYELGEGSLSELLAARRLAQEQQLVARLAGVDSWHAHQRLALESGTLWAPPPAVLAPLAQVGRGSEVAGR